MDERYLDMASALAEAERAAAVAGVQRAMAQAGQAECEDCGVRIDPLRRQAAPHAIRCITCQEVLEHRRRCSGGGLFRL